MDTIICSLKRRNKLLSRMKIIAGKGSFECSELNHIYDNGVLLLDELIKSYPEMENQKNSIDLYLTASQNILINMSNDSFFKNIECEIDEILDDVIDEGLFITQVINHKLDMSLFN